ncbi:MAG: MBL fold metallo-hydrolase [Verrucomicrobiaceae bacterium]|nr:MBL fold metallo-hydrolase [Verrucomicrobiaceae bacterium]
MGELHCLNVGCGDTSVIKSGAATFLVDCYNIEDHKHLLPASKNIRGVFITHQHTDHFSGLHYLKDNGFSIDVLVYSPYDRRRDDSSVTLEEWNDFISLRDHFSGKGTKLFTPYRQQSFDKPYWETDGIKFEVVGPAEHIAKSQTRELHDACLVVLATLGTRFCLFTGDASDANLANIAQTTKNYCDDILHASHHGSINGAEEAFIKKANASYTVISTKEGVYENVPHPEALKIYQKHTKQKVYRTDIDGTLKWNF